MKKIPSGKQRGRFFWITLLYRKVLIPNGGCEHTPLCLSLTKHPNWEKQSIEIFRIWLVTHPQSSLSTGLQTSCSVCLPEHLIKSLLREICMNYLIRTNEHTHTQNENLDNRPLTSSNCYTTGHKKLPLPVHDKQCNGALSADYLLWKEVVYIFTNHLTK
jgi:hypothetical protein